jgi:hypothetical protein
MAQTNGESTGELLKQFSQDATMLIRKEVELAKAELTEKGKQAGKGAGMFGGAGLFGLGAFGALTAFLILGAIAGVLALQGKHKVEEAAPPQPEQTVETLKEDIEWAKRQPESVRK